MEEVVTKVARNEKQRRNM